MWFWAKDPTTNFPYEIGDIITGLEEKSFWVLHKGKRKVCHYLIAILKVSSLYFSHICLL